jgi:hypothetical protein
MKKVTVIILCVISCFVFTGCPCECYERFEENMNFSGGYIENIPKWCNDECYTSWKPWQSETGKLLNLYIPKEVNFSNYQGNYRLLIKGQSLILFFDDKNRTAINLLHIWIPYKKENEYVDKNEDSCFYFNGWAKTNGLQNNSDENRAFVKFDLFSNDETEYTGNYSLLVNNKIIVNESFNKKTENFIASKSFAWESIFNVLSFDSDSCFYIIDFLQNIKSYVIGFKPCGNLGEGLGDLDNSIEKVSTNTFLYPYGSMNIHSETENSVTFLLSDGTENMPKYLVITKKQGNNYTFDWYKELAGQLMYSENLIGRL